EPLAAGAVQAGLGEDAPARADAQAQRARVVGEIEEREPRRVDERHELVLRPPGAVGRGRAGEAKAEHAVAGDAAVLVQPQAAPLLGAEPLHRIAIERGDLRHYSTFRFAVRMMALHLAISRGTCSCTASRLPPSGT